LHFQNVSLFTCSTIVISVGVFSTQVLEPAAPEQSTAYFRRENPQDVIHATLSDVSPSLMESGTRDDHATHIQNRSPNSIQN
jgi:hypothetical protein